VAEVYGQRATVLVCLHKPCWICVRATLARDMWLGLGLAVGLWAKLWAMGNIILGNIQKDIQPSFSP
jgi:hypothetical protein